MSSNFNGTLSKGQWIRRGPSPYTLSQIESWISVIGFPSSSGLKEQTQNGIFRADLNNLVTLTRLHLVAFPFENLQMHYSPDHDIDIDPQYIYKRLVLDRKGSYCFGKGGLFFGMLRGLGYRCYPVQMRTNNSDVVSAPRESPVYTPALHMALMVQPIEDSNTTYLVDVAFGGPGLSRPILLSDAEDNVVTGLTPTELHRLTLAPFSGGESVVYDAKDAQTPTPLWRLEVMRKKENSSSNRWNIVYTFDETERFPEDFIVANHHVVTYPKSTPFYDTVVVMKYFWITREGIEGEEDLPIGDRHLGIMTLYGNRLKKNMGTKSEVLELLTTERERVDAIQKYFGIDVETDGKVEEIEGRPAALLRPS